MIRAAREGQTVMTATAEIFAQTMVADSTLLGRIVRRRRLLLAHGCKRATSIHAHPHTHATSIRIPRHPHATAQACATRTTRVRAAHATAVPGMGAMTQVAGTMTHAVAQSSAAAATCMTLDGIARATRRARFAKTTVPGTTTSAPAHPITAARATIGAARATGTAAQRADVAQATCAAILGQGVALHRMTGAAAAVPHVALLAQAIAGVNHRSHSGPPRKRPPGTPGAITGQRPDAAPPATRLGSLAARAAGSDGYGDALGRRGCGERA